MLDGIDGQGDIVDDDPVPSMSIADVSVGESYNGMVNAVFTVTMTNDTEDVVTVNYATADGTALGGFDYAASSGTLTFLPGETSHVITHPDLCRDVGEGTESFYVNLSNVTGAIVAKSTGMVTITPPALWVTSSTADFGLGTVGTGAYSRRRAVAR